MFTKCLRGGQESLDIKDIISSGKYDIKGWSIYYNGDKVQTLPKSLSVNKSGYLLFFSFATREMSWDNYDINFTIDTGIANTSISIISRTIKFFYYDFALLDKDDYAYNFDVSSDKNEPSLNKSKYDFPKDTSDKKYIVNTNSSMNVDYFYKGTSYIKDTDYYYKSYFPIKFNHLNINVAWDKNYPPSDFPSTWDSSWYFAKVVYAIPK